MTEAMEIMRARHLISALALFVGLSGCVDGNIDAPPRGTIVLDLGALSRHTIDGVQFHCITAAHEAVLRVDNRRHASVPITQEVSSVYFEDVEVRPGRVRFDVEIQSGTDALLYAGSETVDVEDDGFQVGISLERQNGVLRVCPADQQAVRAGAWLEISNIGDRPITVDLPVPPSGCNGPCFAYIESPTRFGLDPGSERSIDIRMSEGASGSYTLRIASDVGPADVVIRLN